MSAWLLWRFVKFAGVAAFGAGCLGAWASQPADRARLALGAATVGWLATWTAGWGLVKIGGASMGAPWVSASMLLSLLALAATAAAVTGGRARLWTGVGAGALAASIAAMVLRDASAALPLALALGLPFGALGAWGAREAAPVDAGTLRRWFGALAWMEGVSLLALFGLYMPAKYALHVELDGGQGWFGWAHGMLVIGYCTALGLTALRLRWSVLDVGLGFVASFFPLGTFWFERRMERRAG